MFQELLQNANDAEATVVKFALDERTYGTDVSKLLDKNMAKYQGAALYAYNDELFKQEDWRGIQQPGRSGKKKKALKIGRFGIGFNSVYHVTGMPFTSISCLMVTLLLQIHQCVYVCMCVGVCLCVCVCHTEVKVSETTADVSRT